MTYLKWWKGGICNQEYSDQQGSHSDLIEKFKKKNFTDQQELGEFSITKPALQQMLKELL